MNVSDKLRTQMERLQNTGAFSISKTEKEELRDLTKAIGCRELVNLDCGTCVRDAMYQVSAFLKQTDERPKLTKMTMVKSIHEMTYQELRQEAKRKNINVGRNPSKNELINALR